MPPSPSTARRAFLRFLAASPLLAATLRSQAVDPEIGELIKSVDEAINVFDFHAVARDKLPPAHYGYLATGTLDDATLRANRSGFDKWRLRLRRLTNVETLDTSVELFGTNWNSPITLAPVGNQEAFHPEGVRATARAAKGTDTLQILSTVANTAVEDVIEQRGGPVWFQLYPTSDWSVTQAILRRVERAGCPAVALTVDSRGAKQETLFRLAKTDSRDCTLCHDRSKPNNVLMRKPLFDAFDLAKIGALVPYSMDWDFVKRLRDFTPLKLLLKGIVTREDAELAVEHGVDGLIVSNHGGRQDPSGRGTIESLPEVVGGVRGRIPVMIDGGFRRGTDIFKALALGADAVSIGRPYIWGLAAFGELGVGAVTLILQAELEMTMRQAGVTSLAAITGEYVLRR